MRIPQATGGKGSLRWMQLLTAAPTKPLDRAIGEALALPPDVSFSWRSPLLADEYAEYRDRSFLRRLGLAHLEADLATFWPDKGPQWDGLALTTDGKVVLVEAKAHIAELVSSCAAGATSRRTINSALEDAKRHFGASVTADWATGFYQYANRLAHLYFLRQRGVDAHVVFVYFTNDREMKGPLSQAEWRPVLDHCYRALGLARDRAIPGVHSVFIDLVGLGVVSPAG